MPLPDSSGGSAPNNPLSEDKNTDNITENKQSDMSEANEISYKLGCNLKDLNTIQQNIAAQKFISEELGKRRRRPQIDNQQNDI